MDSRNLAIGVLSTTAVILLVGVVIIQTRPQPAWADGMTVAGQDYRITVGSATKGDEELVYVIDAPTLKLVIYRFDHNRKQIELVQGIDLSEMRKAVGDANQPAQGRQPARRGGRGRP